MTQANVYNFDTISPTQITREQYCEVGSSAFQLGLVRRAFKGSTDFEVWSALSGGTQLTETTDYVLGSIDTRATAVAGYNVYTTITISNVTYQTGNIYITYKAVGSYPNAKFNEQYDNLFFNPDGEVDQDGYDGSTPTATKYTLDMARAVISAGTGTNPTYTVNQNSSALDSDDPAKTCYHLNVSVAGVIGTNGFSRYHLTCDNVTMAKLKGRTISCVINVNFEAGETIPCALYDGVSFSTIKNIVGTGSWNEYHFTLTLDAAATQLIMLISLTGSTTFLSYAVGTGDYYINHVRFYLGSDYKPYIPNDFTSSLNRCQSVYGKSYSYGVAPGTITSSGIEYMWKINTSTSVLEFNRSFVQEKLSVPTIKYYSPITGVVDKIHNLTAATDISVSATPYATTGRPGTIVCGSSITAGNLIQAHWAASIRP